jgi:hypothetical protein
MKNEFIKIRGRRRKLQRLSHSSSFSTNRKALFFGYSDNSIIRQVGFSDVFNPIAKVIK